MSFQLSFTFMSTDIRASVNHLWRSKSKFLQKPKTDRYLLASKAIILHVPLKLKKIKTLQVLYYFRISFIHVWLWIKNVRVIFKLEENNFISSSQIILTLILNGAGEFVSPDTGLRSGITPAVSHLNSQCLIRFAKIRKLSILARDSPRHLLLPIPNGIFLSSALNFPSTMNLSGLRGDCSLMMSQKEITCTLQACAVEYKMWYQCRACKAITKRRKKVETFSK